MQILGLNETLDQMVNSCSVCNHGHNLRKDVGHVLRRVMDVEVECQGMKRRQVNT